MANNYGPACYLRTRRYYRPGFLFVVNRLRGRKAVARRKRWLSDHPLCAHCLQSGRLTEATVPDHVIALANGGADDDSNLQSLCAECHKLKTAIDLGHKQRTAIGHDGRPIDPNHYWNKGG